MGGGGGWVVIREFSVLLCFKLFSSSFSFGLEPSRTTTPPFRLRPNIMLAWNSLRSGSCKRSSTHCALIKPVTGLVLVLFSLVLLGETDLTECLDVLAVLGPMAATYCCQPQSGIPMLLTLL